MAWRGLKAVLAFGIRYQPRLGGRARKLPEFTGPTPRLSCLSLRATPQQSPFSARSPMTKAQPEIDVRNPFIPASSPVCRVAHTALLFSVVLAGLAAAVAGLIRQIVSLC